MTSSLGEAQSQERFGPPRPQWATISKKSAVNLFFPLILHSIFVSLLFSSLAGCGADFVAFYALWLAEKCIIIAQSTHRTGHLFQWCIFGWMRAAPTGRVAPAPHSPSYVSWWKNFLFPSETSFWKLKSIAYKGQRRLAFKIKQERRQDPIPNETSVFIKSESTRKTTLFAKKIRSPSKAFKGH